MERVPAVKQNGAKLMSLTQQRAGCKHDKCPLLISGLITLCGTDKAHQMLW